MNDLVVCLGSNISVAKDMINGAIDRLEALGCYTVVRSEFYQTSSPYVNLVVCMRTFRTYGSLLVVTKYIEYQMGRRAEHKTQGLVPIDIDIVIYNDKVVRPDDFSSLYFQEGYSRLNEQKS